MKYNGKQIYPGNYANSAFIIFVQSSASLNRSAIFSVLIGADSSTIAQLNSNLTWQSVTLTAGSGVTINTQAAYKIGNLLFVFASITLSSKVSAYATLLTHGLNARCGWIAPLYTNYKTPTSSFHGIYGDAGNTIIRASQAITAGTYQVSCVIPTA